MTYKEIASRMKVTPKGVDKIWNRLFQILDVKSRVGLTITAVKNGIVAPEETSISAV
jgi:DNA-binding CsgD family transcriptional regulator